MPWKKKGNTDKKKKQQKKKRPEEKKKSPLKASYFLQDQEEPPKESARRESLKYRGRILKGRRFQKEPPLGGDPCLKKFTGSKSSEGGDAFLKCLLECRRDNGVSQKGFEHPTLARAGGGEKKETHSCRGYMKCGACKRDILSKWI